MHRIFQRHHIPPDEFYAKNPRHKLFIFASEMLVMEDEERERAELARGRKVRRGGRL